MNEMNRKEFLETLAGVAASASFAASSAAVPAAPAQTPMPAAPVEPNLGVEPICEDGFGNYSVNGNVMGYTVRIRHNRYRSAILSCIEELQLKVDGQTVDPLDIAFCLNNKEFMIAQLKDQYTEYWYILDKAELRVMKSGGLPKGEHRVDLALKIRIPYIASPWTYGPKPHVYNVHDNSWSRRLTIRG